MSESSHMMEQFGEYLTAPNLPLTAAQAIVGQAVERYSEPWRYYHVVQHMGEVAGFLVDNIDQLQAPRPTLWAAVGHDAIYIPPAPAGVNEHLSAQLITAQLRPHLPGSEVSLVGKYVEKTADHAWDGHDSDLALFLDADLKILGAAPNVFDEYDANIGREYSFVDPEVYRAGRAHVLRGFYDQKRIFITDIAHEQFEKRAKANLERKLDELAVS